MYFNFAALSPETNSGNMYYGTGPDSLHTVATNWAKLIHDMIDAPQLFREVLMVLTEQWLGGPATLMAQAAAPYQAWLAVLISHISQTAKLARRVSDAYVKAHETVVHPREIALNRLHAAQLCHSSMFGEYAADIAALDEEYAKFWARDAQAMETYAGMVLGALSELTPWPQPPEITNEAMLV